MTARLLRSIGGSYRQSRLPVRDASGIYHNRPFKYDIEEENALTIVFPCPSVHAVKHGISEIDTDVWREHQRSRVA